MIPDFWKEQDITISICDEEGFIIYMNDKAIHETFAEQGGIELIGKHILDCHPKPSRSKLKKMMEERTTNSYVRGSGARRRLFHQSPIFQNSKYCGFMEMIIPCPDQE